MSRRPSTTSRHGPWMKYARIIRTNYSFLEHQSRIGGLVAGGRHHLLGREPGIDVAVCIDGDAPGATHDLASHEGVLVGRVVHIEDPLGPGCRDSYVACRPRSRASP